MVLRGLRYSMKGVGRFSGSTRWLGRNLIASGFGVPSVWMKMVRRLRRALEREEGRVRGREGREPAARAGRGDARWLWSCRRAIWLREALVRAGEGRARDSMPLEDTETDRDIILTSVEGS